MGAIVGVIIGYTLGTRAGEQGWVELRDAWSVIASSEEVRDLLAGGLSIAKEMLARGTEMLSDMLGGGSSASPLRSAA